MAYQYTDRKEGELNMGQNIITWLQGKKTYITALAMIAYALSSAYLGKETWQAAYQSVLVAVGLATMRNAISKTVQKP